MSGAACGQQDSIRHSSDVFRFTDGVIHTVTSPGRWRGSDWLVLAGVLGGTAAVTLFDEPVRNYWQRQDNRFLDGVEEIGYHYGKPYTAVGVTAGFYLSGLIFKSSWARETGLMLGSSIFTSSMLMGVMKDAAGRARPEMLTGHLDFHPFNTSASFHSFPSGHSSVAFGISLLLARRVDNVPLKVLFYSLAGTTAVSRMYSDAHWLSDIAFGGTMAWFFADTAISRIEANRFRKVHKQDRLSWSVYPYPGGVSLRAMVR